MAKANRNVELELEIIDKVCSDFKIDKDTFYSKSRNYKIVFTRILVSLILLKVFNYSTIKVAKAINRVTHSTILHYLKKTKTQKENTIINYYIKYYETK